MMEELSVLVKALTRLAVVATAYLEKAQSPLLSVPSEGPAPVEPKVRKPRAPKATVEQPAPTASTATPLTEEESMAKLRDIGNKYVERYSQASPSGADRLRKMIAEVQPGAVKLSALTHEARLTVIDKMMAEI